MSSAIRNIFGGSETEVREAEAGVISNIFGASDDQVLADRPTAQLSTQRTGAEISPDVAATGLLGTDVAATDVAATGTDDRVLAPRQDPQASILDRTDDSAQKEQIKANRLVKEFIELQALQARSDVLTLFPQLQAKRALGTQGAFDVLGQAIPQQLDTFQQGNVAAQQSLLGGLQQFKDIILGTSSAVDFGGFQPQTLSFDPSIAQQQVPDFVRPLPEFELIDPPLSEEQIIELAEEAGRKAAEEEDLLGRKGLQDN